MRTCTPENDVPILQAAHGSKAFIEALVRSSWRAGVAILDITITSTARNRSVLRSLETLEILEKLGPFTCNFGRHETQKNSGKVEYVFFNRSNRSFELPKLRKQ